MYLIGVFLGLVLIFVANRNTKVKNWKIAQVFLTMLYTLGSWVFIFIIALRGIIENS